MISFSDNHKTRKHFTFALLKAPGIHKIFIFSTDFAVPEFPQTGKALHDDRRKPR